MRIFKDIEKGGGIFLRPYIINCIVFWLVAIYSVGEANKIYKGLINYYDTLPNQYFTINSEGTLSAGELFGECIGLVSLDPYGIIMLGNDDDYINTKKMKWYKIHEEDLIKSPLELYTPYLHPVV